jgi:hypothetical protein
MKAVIPSIARDLLKSEEIPRFTRDDNPTIVQLETARLPWPSTG